jgi:hypothetical protein
MKVLRYQSVELFTIQMLLVTYIKKIRGFVFVSVAREHAAAVC